MDADLRDFLIAWGGGPLEDARYEALLARLRSDAEFRRECARQIHTLGMLKVVQAPSPRWLRLEEELRADLLREEAGLPGGAGVEQRVMEALERGAARTHARGFGWPAALAAGLVAVAALATWRLWRHSPATAVPLHLRETLGVVVRTEQVVWHPSTEFRLRQDDLLEPGWLRLRAGRISLALFNGVRIHVEGPAAIQLRSLSHVYCESGRLAVHVPPQSEITDFTIASPGAAIRDLGTEFGFNVFPDGSAEVMVFRGAAEASVLAPNGTTLRSEVVEERAPVRVVPGRGVIEPAALPPERFVQPPRVEARPLRLSADYARAVQQAAPWSYWRFDQVTADRVANAMEGGPPLRVFGTVAFREVGPGNRAAFLDPRVNEPYMQTETLWAGPTGEYALEFLFSSEQYKNSALVGLLTPEDHHLALVELTARDPEHLVHKPGTLRYVQRVPPATYGGVNLFSTRVFFPYRWHHIVAQYRGGRMEMYIDGALAAAAPADPPQQIFPCHVLLGWLRHRPDPPEDVRSLAGYLDEVAVYARALDPATIATHAALAGCGGE
ncbi:MAG: hypothetical protein KatS3mg132_811 [Limisphaera sp.]|nr:MAG: hypothetical protein KatS3mg132_811 [Limisphaera sp.]